MSASSSRAVASFSKVENQTLVFMGAVRVQDKGNLGDEQRAEVIADSCRRQRPEVLRPNGTAYDFTHSFFTFHFQSDPLRGVTPLRLNFNPSPTSACHEF